VEEAGLICKSLCGLPIRRSESFENADLLKREASVEEENKIASSTANTIWAVQLKKNPFTSKPAETYSMIADLNLYRSIN
jgi:hypothetical protein